MKLRFAIGFFVLFLSCSIAAPPAPAQVRATATPGSIALTWTGGLASATFNVYRAPCTGSITIGVCPIASEGVFAIIASPAAGTAGFNDIGVISGNAYSYYVTEACTSACGNNFTGNPYAGESAPSNHVAALVPFPPVAPPPPILNLGAIVAGAGPTENIVTADSLICAQCTPFPAEIHATVDILAAHHP